MPPHSRKCATILDRTPFVGDRAALERAKAIAREVFDEAERDGRITRKTPAHMAAAKQEG